MGNGVSQVPLDFPVEENDEEEVEVGEAVELLEEVLGEEGEQRVLGRAHVVVEVLVVGVRAVRGT